MGNMKILVTGPRGFVGKKIMDCCANTVGAPSLRDADEATVKALLEQVQPDVIIHTAAISDIPTCAAYPEESYRANVVLPELLAKCNSSAKLVVFSSDQVYTGLPNGGPYTEDAVAPANLYAQEKIEMEQRVLAVDPNAVMLRAEWMYDWVAPKGNYIRNVLMTDGPLTFSSGEYRGVTYVKEVADNMEAVAKLPGGAYNFGSETTMDMLTMTREFLTWMGRSNELHDCPPHHNLWMDCSKARKYGVIFSDALEGVKKCALDYELK